MVSSGAWRAFEGGDEAWDAALAPLSGANVFQSAAWARHKADAGWTAARLIADGAAVQALEKRLPGGARVLWARGGPVGEPAAWAGLPAALLEGRGPLAYARVCSYRPADAASERALWGQGWSSPERPLDRPLTYALDLGPGPEALRAGFSSNWGHNLRRGEQRVGAALDWPEPDPAEMEALYRGLESYKGLPPQHRAESLGSLLKALGPKVIAKRVVVEGRTVAFRACAVFGREAVDLLAATSPEGRKLYASYVLLASLLFAARRAGAARYDLGGADPEAAKGVADFKKGTGAALVETLGERDVAEPAAVRWAAGAAIAWKLGRGA